MLCGQNSEYLIVKEQAVQTVTTGLLRVKLLLPLQTELQTCQVKVKVKVTSGTRDQFFILLKMFF
jgi:hypothetical protein